VEWAETLCALPPTGLQAARERRPEDSFRIRIQLVWEAPTNGAGSRMEELANSASIACASRPCGGRSRRASAP